MYRPRLIPVLLIDGFQAVKTIRFGKRINLGDPVNAVSIFNSFRVDELVVLDIGATKAGRAPNFDLLRDIASEANMPFSVGGGVKDCRQIGELLALGAEKVVISTAAINDPGFIRDAVNTFGSSSIAACIDVGTDWRRRTVVRTRSGLDKVAGTPLDIAKRLQDFGVGEILVQSIDRDGMREGYDIGLLAQLSETIEVPVVALGGAGTLQHMRDAYAQSEVNALASGSFFCFKGAGHGVLISYPDSAELDTFRHLRQESIE